MSRTNNVLIVVAGVIFCFVVAACVAVFIAAPEGANTGSLIAILVGSIAPTLASLGVLAKVNNTDAKVDQVSAQTTALTNGLLDSKNRAAIADVIDPSLIRPDAHPILQRDREVRAEYHDPEGEAPPVKS